MSSSQSQSPVQPISSAPGLVAHSGVQGVAIGAATFEEFVAAHVAQLPEEERAPALALLARMSELFAVPSPQA